MDITYMDQDHPHAFHGTAALRSSVGASTSDSQLPGNEGAGICCGTCLCNIITKLCAVSPCGCPCGQAGSRGCCVLHGNGANEGKPDTAFHSDTNVAQISKGTPDETLNDLSDHWTHQGPVQLSDLPQARRAGKVYV